jgi:DNA-binding protein H-NS
MAKSLASILSQIERLQKEAASIQSEVIARIRKDIVKFGLTAEQLFASTGGVKQGNTKLGTKINKGAKPPKYADSAGNTWGGMGKRPEWIRQAIAAGKALEDFLITKATAPTGSKARLSKSVAKKTNAKPAAGSKPAAKKKRAAAKPAVPRKPRSKGADAPAEA